MISIQSPTFVHVIQYVRQIKKLPISNSIQVILGFTLQIVLLSGIESNKGIEFSLKWTLN